MKKGIITTLVFVSIIFANEWKQVKSLNPDDNYEVIRVETSVDNLNFTVMRGLWQTVVISTDFVDMRGFIIIVSANTTDTIPVFVADHKNGRCSYVPKEMTKIHNIFKQNESVNIILMNNIGVLYERKIGCNGYTKATSMLRGKIK